MSGLRLGTPALTTLGMGTAEVERIAGIVHDVLSATQPSKITKGADAGQASMAKYDLPENIRPRAAGAAQELLQQFPLYPGIEL